MPQHVPKTETLKLRAVARARPARIDGTADGSRGSEPVEPTARSSLYEAIGGEPTFRQLIETFYAGVARDPVLRAIYPEEDLGPAAERLRLFLIQYWGGPSTYTQRRGHPRLRMRHAPFAINATARDAWLGQMRAALDSLGLAPEHDRQLWAYFTAAAESLRNTPE